MEILSNQKIKAVFCKILLLMGMAYMLFAAFFMWMPDRAAAGMLIGFPLLGVLLLTALYQYFREQHRMMENAVGQMEEYISGNHDMRLACDEEGEFYKLFHEINSLAAILNAHAENEVSSKKFMKDTLSDISHQLKTPLAALNVYVGIMQEEAKDNPTIQKFAALSERELDRIEALIQNLLKIAKLDAGAILLEKTKENVADMMGDIGRHFDYRAKQEEKEWLLSGSDDVSLCCDRLLLTEAISNLVKNAFDHTKKGNSIHLEWRESASIVQIKISDNGSGIHPEDLYHIFKRFYRSRFPQNPAVSRDLEDSGNSSCSQNLSDAMDMQGIGLGLPLAKTIVEAHGGTIEVCSELGAGSAFTVNFPIPTKL